MNKLKEENETVNLPFCIFSVALPFGPFSRTVPTFLSLRLVSSFLSFFLSNYSLLMGTKWTNYIKIDRTFILSINRFNLLWPAAKYQMSFTFCGFDTILLHLPKLVNLHRSSRILLVLSTFKASLCTVFMEQVRYLYIFSFYFHTLRMPSMIALTSTDP